MDPQTRYARTPDGAYIAYQVVGDGGVDLVWQLDFVGDIDLVWETPTYGDFLRGLASFSRLILHDRRGLGLSSRNATLGNLETRGADLRAVLGLARSDRPLVLGGERESGAPNALLAATDPHLANALVWWQPMPRIVWAPDYPWGVGPDYVKAFEQEFRTWGTSDYATAWLGSEAVAGVPHTDEEAVALARLTRHTCTPDVALELERIWYESDVRGILPSIQTSTLLIADHADELPAYVASLLPNAHLAVIPSVNQSTPEALEHGLEAIRHFIGVDRPTQGLDTVLSTVLFTDIVDSTQKQAALGDRAWKELAERHHAVVRESLRRWHGIENDTAGDGFYATFDGPARAIRCALEVADRVRPLGIEVRAGVHTGECEVVETKCAGLTVSIGARVASNARASEVLVTQTVKDLVAGSGFAFEDAGEYELKGVPGRWRLMRVASQPELADTAGPVAPFVRAPADTRSARLPVAASSASA